MLMVAVLLFLIASLLGIYLLKFVLQRKNTPKGIAFIHGPVAASGLLLLVIYAFIYRPAPLISIIIFIFAALGGFVLIYRDITGKSVPRWLAIAHGTIAMIGFITLMMFVLI